MIVVSNTSPIINLATIGQLILLRQLYGNITVPEAVFREIATDGADLPGAVEVQTASWIATQAVKNQLILRTLHLELDAGEAAAIALGLEMSADLLLLDEQLARGVARRLGLKFIGLLGILIEAKQRQIILSVKPLLDALKDEAGFWIAPRLYHYVLETAGE